MKIYRFIPLVILSALILLSGCEKDADNIKLFEVSSKLVVHAFISPQDTVLKVHLQKSQPALGKKLNEEQLLVTNAKVVISDENSSVTLAYNPDHRAYFSKVDEWNIVAGKTYKLTVTAPGGLSATATCTVPRTTGVEITDVAASYTLEDNYYGDGVRKYKIAFKWKDAPDVYNYYRAMASRTYWYKGYNGERQEGVEPLYLDHGKAGLYKDEKANNGIIQSDDFYFYKGFQPDVEDKYRLQLLLVVADKNYYLYQDALHKQSESNGNPFAEPVIMHSNIEGGLGVFAGYNQVETWVNME